MGVVFFPSLPFMGVMLFLSFRLGNASGEGSASLALLSLFLVFLLPSFFFSPLLFSLCLLFFSPSPPFFSPFSFFPFSIPFSSSPDFFLSFSPFLHLNYFFPFFFILLFFTSFLSFSLSFTSFSHSFSFISISLSFPSFCVSPLSSSSFPCPFF